jgi:hypothetical protein
MKVSGGIDERSVVQFTTKMHFVREEIRRQVIDIVMVALCEKIKEEAWKRCPVDEGHLEKTIKFNVWEAANVIHGDVFIDTGDGEARDYAMRMHEDHYKIGPKSQEKQSRYGVEVGRKFLERGTIDSRAALNVILFEKGRGLFNAM